LTELIDLTPELVSKMRYREFLSLLQISFRLPGSKRTITKLIQNTFITQDSFVLEIGSHLGSNAREIARLTNCKVVGMDINEKYVALANKITARDPIAFTVKFIQGDARNIPFQDNTFDVVLLGGLIGTVTDVHEVIAESFRVVKPWGFVAIIQAYYTSPPPQTLLKELGQVLNIPMKPWPKEKYIDLFVNAGFEVFITEEIPVEMASKEDIEDYFEIIRNRLSKRYPDDVINAIERRWNELISLFSQLKDYTKLMLGIFRKPAYHEEAELFDVYSASLFGLWRNYKKVFVPSKIHVISSLAKKFKHPFDLSRGTSNAFGIKDKKKLLEQLLLSGDDSDE